MGSLLIRKMRMNHRILGPQRTSAFPFVDDPDVLFAP